MTTIIAMIIIILALAIWLLVVIKENKNLKDELTFANLVAEMKDREIKRLKNDK